MRGAGVAGVVAAIVAASCLSACGGGGDDGGLGDAAANVQATLTETNTTAEPPASTTAPAASTPASASTAPATTLPPLTLDEIGSALHDPAVAYINSHGGPAETEALRLAAKELVDSGRTRNLPSVPTHRSEAVSASILLEFIAAQPEFVWIKSLERGGALRGLPAFFIDGIYRVGGEVKAGTYETFDVELCFWQRIDPQGKQIDSFYAETAPRVVVTIMPSDYGFAATKCGVWFEVA